MPNANLCCWSQALNTVPLKQSAAVLEYTLNQLPPFDFSGSNNRFLWSILLACLAAEPVFIIQRCCMFQVCAWQMKPGTSAEIAAALHHNHLSMWNEKITEMICETNVIVVALLKLYVASLRSIFIWINHSIAKPASIANKMEMCCSSCFCCSYFDILHFLGPIYF